MKIAGNIALLALLAVSTGVGPQLAFAADMEIKAAPPPRAPAYVQPPFGWTGFYLGGNLGVAWAGADVTDSSGRTLNIRTNGTFIGGGQVGFNVQLSSLVIGVEGDFDWTGNKATSSAGVVIPTVGTVQLTNSDQWIATVAGRVGVAVDHWLLYGKAGVGWVGNDSFTLSNQTTSVSIAGLGSSTNIGWLGGLGIEYAVANNWSIKLEYDYLGLVNETITVPAGSPFLVGDLFVMNNRNIQTFKVGVNFLFNWWQPVALR